MSIDMELVRNRADSLREMINRFASRPVRVVAVTKGFGSDAISAAASAGIADIGENYAQELLSKELVIDVSKSTCHFIGHLQSNKVKKIAHVVDVWHTVDSSKLGRQIAAHSPGANVFVQVNSSGNPGHSGVELSAARDLVDQLRNLELDVQGLMTIGVSGDLGSSFEVFENVRTLADELDLADCSMGMSDDLKEALLAGSTMVRVGTALFGPRYTR